MNRYISRCCVLISLACMIVTCGPRLPQIRVWRPWMRSLQAEEVKSKATLTVNVTGTCSPLLGNQSLTQSHLGERLLLLLERRGFEMVETNADYRVTLVYDVQRHDKLVSQSSIASLTLQDISYSSATGAKATSALGVAIARTIGTSALRTATAASQTTSQEVAYTHTLSVEFVATDGRVVWQGEATWDTRELDVIASLSAPLQLVLSDLPSDPSYLPIVPAVKESHAENYYAVNCHERWFSCPALPFMIAFQQISQYYPSDPIIGSGIKNMGALPAYVDLLQTAEYALPSGSNNWNDPTDIDLWKKATLGGKYRLGPGNNRVNIIIELSGTKEGYLVDRAWVATDDEYRAFETKFQQWKGALRDYFDVYQQ